MATITKQQFNQLLQEAPNADTLADDLIARGHTIEGYKPPQKVGFVQGLAQEVARPFLKTGLHIARGPFGTKEPKQFGYLGEVKPITSAREAIGTGLELGSSLMGGGAIKNIVQAGLRGAIKQGFKAGVKTGAVGGGAFSGGRAIEEGKSPQQVALETVLGTIAGTVGGGVLGAITPLPAAGLRRIFRAPIQKVNEAIKQGVDRGIKPYFRQINQKARDRYYQAADLAVNTINKIKPTLTNKEGVAVQRNPENRIELLEGINQTKNTIFQFYNRIAEQAGELGGKFNPDPIISKLVSVSKSLKHNPQTRNYARKLIPQIEELRNQTPDVIQERIKDLNVSLEPYFAGRVEKAKAQVDASVAAVLREELDNLIESLTGQPYQEFKNIYGALKTIEKDVARQVAVEVRRNPKGLLDFTDIFTGGDLIAGVVTMNPMLVTRGIVGRGAKEFYKRLNDPNRYIKNMFRAVGKGRVSTGFSTLGKKPESVGAFAGVEKDEEGRPTFSPEKAALGIAGVTAFTRGRKTVLGEKVFKGFKDLTTKFLDYAKGKTTLSRQEILDFARRPELKKGEADLLLRKLGEFEPKEVSKTLKPLAQEARKHKSAEEFVRAVETKTTNLGESDFSGLNRNPKSEGAKLHYDFMEYAQKPEVQKIYEQGGNDTKVLTDFYNQAARGKFKIPAQEFADSIRRDLLELKPVKVKEPQFRNISIQGARGELHKGQKNYEEVVFESPITTNGSSHYPNSKNYFAHARGDEVVEGGKKIWREQEIQSDLLQKDNLENQANKLVNRMNDVERKEYDKLESFRQNAEGTLEQRDAAWKRQEELREAADKRPQSEMFSKLSPFINDRFGERIMRERIRDKAGKGYVKYRLPTGETVGKIEGFEGGWTTQAGEKALPENVKIGDTILMGGHDPYLVTKMLPNGQVKAINEVNFPQAVYAVRPDDFATPARGSDDWAILQTSKRDIEQFSETFDLTGKSNPQYRRYEDWGKFLKNKFGGKEITDPQGNSWMEVDLKSKQGRLPVEAFGVAALPSFIGRKKEE